MIKEKIEYWSSDLEDKWLNGYSITNCLLHLEMNDLTDEEIDEVFRYWIGRDNLE